MANKRMINGDTWEDEFFTTLSTPLTSRNVCVMIWYVEDDYITL